MGAWRRGLALLHQPDRLRVHVDDGPLGSPGAPGHPEPRLLGGVPVEIPPSPLLGGDPLVGELRLASDLVVLPLFLSWEGDQHFGVLLDVLDFPALHVRREPDHVVGVLVEVGHLPAPLFPVPEGGEVDHSGLLEAFDQSLDLSHSFHGKLCCSGDFSLSYRDPE